MNKTSVQSRHYQIRRFTLFSCIILIVLSLIPASTTPPATLAQSFPWRDKSSPFGVVAALGNRVREDEIDAAVDLMVEAGVQWQREEIFWHEVQYTPGGPFYWTGNESGLYNYDRAIEAQVRRGINILGLLDYNPAWFKGKNPTPEEWIEDWGNFVYNAVARYGRDRGWIKYWELWNEPNLAKYGYESGLYTVRDFVRILEVGRAAALAADPEAKIVLGGLASIWGMPPSEYNYDYFEYLLGIAEQGGWDQVDILAIHLYRPEAPEGATGGRYTAMDLRTELDHLDEFLRRFGPKPVWITEIGWPTSAIWPGVDEDTQAFYLIRTYILTIAHASVEKIFWYDFRNDTDPYALYHQPAYDSNNEQYHYGLLRRTYPLSVGRGDIRKPSFVAFRTMTHMLSGLSLTQVIADGNELDMPGIYWYRFSDGRRTVDVVWRTNDTVPELTTYCGCTEALVRSWNGNVKRLIYSGNSHIGFYPDTIGAPMYIEYDPPPAEDGEYFDVTGHRLRGAFRNFWHAHGGLERFGFPITDELIETEYGSGFARTVQYFDRSRLTFFAEHGGTPYQIQAAHLGLESLAQQGVDWYTLPKATNVTTETLYFEQTGHKIEEPFRAFWEQFGGVPMVGYPLSEAVEMVHPETGQPYVVQYFERARIEYYPEHEGEPARIQFGLLGRELITAWGRMP